MIPMTIHFRGTLLKYVGKFICAYAFLCLGLPDNSWALSEDADTTRVDSLAQNLGVSTIVAEGYARPLNENSRSVLVLRSEDLRKKHVLSLSDALRNQAGIEIVEQGPNIAKPSIRGMTNQRIVLVRDGIRHEAQQWSNHHTPEVDVSEADQIEVLRGPGSLLYGSGALGGVVLLRSPEVETLQDGADSLGGDADYTFFTNSVQHAGHAGLHGATDHFMWRGDLSGRFSPYYAVPGENHFLVKQAAGAVNDSVDTEYAAFKNYNVRLMGGYHDNGLKVSLSGVQYWEEQTLIGEGHWHNSGGPNGGPWYHVGEPIISPTLHQKVEARGEKQLGSELFAFETALQHDHRQGIPGSVGVQVDLENYLVSGNLRWIHGKTETGSHTVGLSATQKWDRSYGVEVLIPDCNTTDGGLFYLYSGKLPYHMILSAGVRGDYRRYEIFRSQMTEGFRPVESLKLRGEKMDSIPSLIVEGSGRMVVPSFSTGLSWVPMKELTLGFNFGSGFRLPDPNELAILGAHHGSYEYMVGLAIDDPSAGTVRIRNIGKYRETALNTEGVIRWTSRRYEAELSVFYNRMYDYIFARPTGEFVWLTSISALPVKEYVQADARFYGFEFQNTLHLGEKLSLRGLFNLTIGEILDPVEDADGDGNVEPWLPQISPPHAGGEVIYQFPWRLSASLGVDGYCRQTRLAEFENVLRRNSDGTNTEFTSEGYVLWNAGLQWQKLFTGKRLILSLKGTNLLNTRYTSHLSSYKGIADDPGFGVSFKADLSF